MVPPRLVSTDRSRWPRSKQRSVNETLANAFHVLSFEKVRSRQRPSCRPSLLSSRAQSRGGTDRLGASVFGVTEVHARLAPFAAAWRAGGRPPLYVVAADVTRAFDTLQHAQLQALADSFFQEARRPCRGRHSSATLTRSCRRSIWCGGMR
jgi:hypothetical protein